jgi:hypothetical protein
VAQGVEGAELLDICKIVEAQPSLLLQQTSEQESPVRPLSLFQLHRWEFKLALQGFVRGQGVLADGW